MTEKHYRVLVDNAQSIIYLIDADGTLTFVSPSWTALLGHEAFEVEGQNFALFVHGDDIPTCQAFLEKTVETGKTQTGVEYRVFHKNGSTRWHRSNISPVYDERGVLVSFVGNAVDISDYRKIEEELREANRELLEARDNLKEKIVAGVEEMREKDDLIGLQARQVVMGEIVGFIAHQWKQNLYAVSLYSGTLRNLGATAVVRSPHADVALDGIDAAVRGMMETITGFRDFMSPPRESTRFGPATTLDGTLGMLGDMLSMNRIDVERDMDETLRVEGNPNELQQVFMNLLINAKEAITQGQTGRGRIRISLHGDKGRVRIRIEDNGGGIPPDILPRLFTKFVSGKKDGAGLGLYLSRMIVERRFGGTITVDDGDRGAVFTLEIPGAL